MGRKHSVPKEKSQTGETLSFAHLKILSLLSILEAGGEDPQNYQIQYGFFKHNYRWRGVL
jgi:hypothetical protein